MDASKEPTAVTQKVQYTIYPIRSKGRTKAGTGVGSFDTCSPCPRCDFVFLPFFPLFYCDVRDILTEAAVGTASLRRPFPPPDSIQYIYHIPYTVYRMY